LNRAKHPEEIAIEIWERLRQNEKFLMCEVNIVFSCVYVIVLFSETRNPNMRFFLTRIKQWIDVGCFQEFEFLIREKFMQIAVVKECFDLLKTIDFTEQAKPLTPATEKQEYRTTEKVEMSKVDVYTKVRAFALFELLRTFGITTAEHDLSKICRLIAGITGSSYHNIYSCLQKGIVFKKNHDKQIHEINHFFAELNIPISIKK